jgi:hypothetical protein
MGVIAYNHGVAAVSIKEGTAGEPGLVSWHFLGHWSLSAAGYTAINSQVSSYFTATSSTWNKGDVTTRFSVNDFNGEFTAWGQDLAAQAGSINAIVTNTGYLNGGM